MTTDTNTDMIMDHVRSQNEVIASLCRTQIGLHAGITNAEHNIVRLWYMTIGLLLSIVGLCTIGLMMIY